jgi:hypothetical protein
LYVIVSTVARLGVATVLRMLLGMVLWLTLGDALGTVLGDTLGPMLVLVSYRHENYPVTCIVFVEPQERTRMYLF